MPISSLPKILAVAAPLAIGVAGIAFAQTGALDASAPDPAPIAQAAAPGTATPAATPIAQIAPTGIATVQGDVVEVFGNKFVLQDASGRTLIETGPRGREATLVKVGDRVTVEGRSEGGFIGAAALVRADGRREELQPTAPSGLASMLGLGSRYDQAVLVSSVERAGYTSPRILDVKKKHAEVAARDAQGAEWELHVEFDGRIRERERAVPRLDEAQVRAMLTRAGYVYGGRMDAKKKHLEVLATNDRGESVELHIDREGSIYKEKRRFW